MTDISQVKVRQPQPVGNLSIDSPEHVADLVLQIRRRRVGPHVPFHVFVRDGLVYVLRQTYTVCHLWEVLYPSAMIGVYSGRWNASDLAADLALARDEYFEQIGRDIAPKACDAPTTVEPIRTDSHGQAQSRRAKQAPKVRLRVAG